MSLFDYSDNPLRVAGPGELRGDPDYDGDIADDDCHEDFRTPSQVLADAFAMLKPEPVIGFNDGVTVDGYRVSGIVVRSESEDDGDPA